MTKYTLKDFQKMERDNRKLILKANKGLPQPVCFLEWYVEIGNFSCFITEYVDGNGIVMRHRTII